MTNKQSKTETANDFMPDLTLSFFDPEILAALEGMTPVDQMELIEWLTAGMTEGKDTPSRLRRIDEVKELNVQEWFERKLSQ